MLEPMLPLEWAGIDNPDPFDQFLPCRQGIDKSRKFVIIGWVESWEAFQIWTSHDDRCHKVKIFVLLFLALCYIWYRGDFQ
jgi:hypothetical protein